MLRIAIIILSLLFILTPAFSADKVQIDVLDLTRSTPKLTSMDVERPSIVPADPTLEARLRAKGQFPPQTLREALDHLKGSAPQRLRGPLDQTGTKHALVLLVDFSDKVATTAQSHYASMLFSDGSYATGSLRDYYQEISYQQLDVLGDVSGQGTTPGWYRAPHNRAYYGDGQYGMGDYPRNSQGLVVDLVPMADPYVDFSLYDNDGDGVVDALFLVHAGRGGEQTGNTDDIWSHAWAIPIDLYADGVQIYGYSIEPEDGHIGVFCHEFGHVLGLPDLYDYGYDSWGTGNWSLMSQGCWGNNGVTPVHMDAWSLTQMGWVDPIVVDGTTVTGASLPAIETSPTMYKIPAYAGSTQEYFLIENRRKIGFDSYISGQGLIIYHVDETVYGNNDQPHYEVGVEPADGRFDLENNGSVGDAGDPWPGSSNNRTFTNTTTPNSLSWTNQYYASVTNISNAGTVMTCNITAGLSSLAPAGWMNPGWNWISVPLQPTNPNAGSIFGEANVANKFFRWDDIGKTVQGYPDDFQDVDLGIGYLLFTLADLRPTIVGGAQQGTYGIPIALAGWKWIGDPKLTEIPLTSLSVRNENTGVVRTAQQDKSAADPWLNWNFVYWNSTQDTAAICTFPGTGGDDDRLRPWYGYRLWSNTENLTLLVP